ncbi:putative protein OS=Streptomyces tendae OX=1932 GN=GUR47_11025 PE=4 SV=1 [Streptomyces tendae]
MNDTWTTIARLATRLEEHYHAPPASSGSCSSSSRSRRTAGEVAEAVIGAMGQNPRKGFSHTWEEVEAEICDVIVTGMVALMRINPQAPEESVGHLNRIRQRDVDAAATEDAPR